MNYEEKKRQVEDQLRDIRDKGYAIGLEKQSSNLFRVRNQGKIKKINVRHFTSVLHVDPKKKVAVVEGMTTFEDLVDATLAHNLLPEVVPELKTITVGGAVSGIGIESSSFKYGLLHETITEMDVLTSEGQVKTCSPKKNKDLFYAMPNSYGTLGYILRLTVKLISAAPYLKITHEKYTDVKEYFKAMRKYCLRLDQDYIDGTVFSNHEMYITRATFTNDAPYTSTYKKTPYYLSIKNRTEDYVSAYDYIWRWDTDWFWCSKNLGMQNPLLRSLFPFLLGSKQYTKLMRLNAKYKFQERFNKMFRPNHRTEAVIQDVEVPLENAGKFLKFFLEKILVRPIWICPCIGSNKYPLYSMEEGNLYMNFGFWDIVPTLQPDGYFNKLVEEKVMKLHGKKSLYSTSYFDEETFWEQYNGVAYEKLKKKHDPDGFFKDLYEKCVLKK